MKRNKHLEKLLESKDILEKNKRDIIELINYSFINLICQKILLYLFLIR